VAGPRREAPGGKQQRGCDVINMTPDEVNEGTNEGDDPTRELLHIYLFI
jgi:hypothetical protein